MYLGDVLSFALMQKKDTKEKIKAALPGLLRHCHAQTGLELASLKQSPLTCAWQCLRSHPYSEAGRPCGVGGRLLASYFILQHCGVTAQRLHRAAPGHRRRCVSVGAVRRR